MKRHKRDTKKSSSPTRDNTDENESQAASDKRHSSKYKQSKSDVYQDSESSEQDCEDEVHMPYYSAAN